MFYLCQWFYSYCLSDVRSRSYVNILFDTTTFTPVCFLSLFSVLKLFRYCLSSMSFIRSLPGLSSSWVFSGSKQYFSNYPFRSSQVDFSVDVSDGKVPSLTTGTFKIRYNSTIPRIRQKIN